MTTTSTQVADAYQAILLNDPPGGANGAYALSVTAQINDGLLTLGNFESSLLGLDQTMYTTLPALVTIDAFYGATPSLSTLTTAATATSGTSYDSALELHNLGYSDANVWTIMGADWGADPNSQFYQLYSGLATGNTADYQTFINEVYQREFGTLPTQANLQNLLNDIPGLQQLLSGGGHTATAIQVMGGLFGYLLYAGQSNNVGTYGAPAVNFLTTAATDEANAPGSSASLYGGQDFLKIPGIVPTGTQTTQDYLTAGADNVTANNVYGDLTPYTFNGVGPTLNSEDVINGSPGSTDNTLTITDGYAQGQDILPAGVTINNIQNIVLQTAGNAGAGASSGILSTPNSTPLDVSQFPSVTQLKVTSSGANFDVINGGTNTAVTVQHNNSIGGVEVTGGSSVTINTAGDGTTSSLLNGVLNREAVGVTVGQYGVPSADPTGAVSITDTAGSANANGGDIYVYGGSAVSISATNATYDGFIDVGDAPNQQPTGAVSVQDDGEGGSINVYGGTDVSVTVAPTLSPSAGGQNADVTVGDSSGAYQQPSGNVTVTQTAKVAYDGLSGAAHNDTTSGSVAVYGGTNVTVASNSGGGITIGSTATGTANPVAPSGAVTVTDTSSDLNGKFGIGNYANDSGTTIQGGATASANVTAEGASVTVNLAQSTSGTNTNGSVQVTETGVSHTNVTVDGGNGVAVNAQGQTVNIGTNAGTGGPQVVNQSAVLTGAGLGGGYGAVTVDGGSSVTVTTSGGNVTVGGTPTGVFSSGPVSVTDTFGGVNSDSISVQGGSTVGITTTPTSGNITVGSGAPTKTNLVQDPTGNVTIVDAQTNGSSTVYGTGAVNVTTNGGSSVSIQGGAVGTVQDAQAALKGTSTLASVSLDGVQTGGAVNITSDALTGLTVADNQVAGNLYTINNSTSGHDLALTLNNDSTAFTVQDNTAGAVTVGDNGTASTGIVTLTATKATGVTFNNTAALSANLTNDGSLTTVTASGSGALNLGNLSGLGALTSVNAAGATGGVTAEINGNTSFTGGSGANTVIEDSNPANWAKGVKVNGGSGSANTIVANYVANGETLSSDVSGFQTLGLGQNASGTFDATGFSAEQVSGTTNGSFSNVADGSTLTLENSATATGSGNTVGFFHKNFTSETATINLGLDNTTSAASKIGVNATGNIVQAVSTDSKTVTVNSAGFIGKSNGATVTDTLQLNDGNLTTLNIGGDQATTINSGAAVTTIDASKSTGSIVDVSGVAGALSGVTVTGGSGVLVAHGAESVSGGVTNADVGITQYTETLGGGWGVGDHASVTINGLTYSYTVQASDVGPGLNMATAEANVATGLANVVNASVPGVTATTNGGQVVITATTPGADLSVTQVDPTFTNGLSVATTTANQPAVAQQDTVSVTGSWTAGDTVTETVNGHTYTYAVQLGDTDQTIANGLAAQIGTAGGALASAVANPDATVTLTAANAGTSFTATVGTSSATGGVQDTTTTQSKPAVARVDTITVSGGWGVGDTATETINGTQYSYTVQASDEGATQAATDAKVAAGLANAIGNAGGALASAVANGDGTITLTAATPGTDLTQDVALTPSATGTESVSAPTTVSPASVPTGAQDVFTVGTGGGQITIGAGGGWNQFLNANNGGNDTGSETVNLGNETQASNLIVGDGAVAWYNGQKGGVNSFHITASSSTSDALTFANSGVNDPKQVLANIGTTAVSAVASAAAAAILDPSGSLANVVNALNYTVSNGLITFSGNGGQAISNFTPSQLQQVAQLIVDASGPNTVAAFSTLGDNGVGSTGDIVVVASASGPSIYSSGGLNYDANSVTDLRGLATSASSVQGFGTTAAANTIVVTDLAEGADVNTGSAAKDTTYTTSNSGGLQQHDGFTVGAATITNTYNDLSGSAQLNIGGTAAGNLVVNQNGTSGQESLTLNFTGPVTLASVTETGDNLLAITGSSVDEVKSLSDSSGTLQTITISGTEALTLDTVTASALTSIKAGSADGSLTLGGANSALSQAGLNVTVGNGTDAIYASGAGDTITAGNGSDMLTASGAGDTITAGNGNDTIVANGDGDTITAGNGSNVITANGAGDTISVGTGASAIHASGANDSITFSGTQTGAATVDGGAGLGVGANATVTFSKTFSGGSEQVVLTGDTAGATTAGNVSMVTLINGLNAAGESLVFQNAGTESLAGGSMAGSQVNMSSITAQTGLSASGMLSSALNLAASLDAASQNAAGTIGANSGVLDWFQLNGNTYIVEATNKTTASAAHTALAAGDTVVKLSGLVDLSHSTFNGGILHI